MVYVDPLITLGGSSAPRCFRNKPSCHMYADTLDELHSLAAKIGLRREWFQDSLSLQHYDLTPPKRARAVSLGAVEHDRRSSVEKWKELRNRRIELRQRQREAERKLLEAV